MAGNNNGRLTNAIGESLSPAAIKLTVPRHRAAVLRVRRRRRPKVCVRVMRVTFGRRAEFAAAKPALG